MDDCCKCSPGELIFARTLLLLLGDTLMFLLTDEWLNGSSRQEIRRSFLADLYTYQFNFGFKEISLDELLQNINYPSVKNAVLECLNQENVKKYTITRYEEDVLYLQLRNAGNLIEEVKDIVW